MTFHQLLNEDDIDIWTATTDEELTKILQPYFFVTRPTTEQVKKMKEGGSLAAGEKTMSVAKAKKQNFNNLMNDLFSQASARGIVLPPGTPLPNNTKK
jgi:hypothetical protein